MKRKHEAEIKEWLEGAELEYDRGGVNLLSQWVTMGDEGVTPISHPQYYWRVKKTIKDVYELSWSKSYKTPPQNVQTAKECWSQGWDDCINAMKLNLINKR